MSKNIKNKIFGKSLKQKFLDKKIKKNINKGMNTFTCSLEPPAHEACGHCFSSASIDVHCPKCGNLYCRWENYTDSEKLLSHENSE